MSTAAAPTRRSRPRGAARREALLEAALRIVAEVGADAVTHRRVAEAAGLPLASTTYWFHSKEHLLTAALELAAERDTARVHAHAAAAAVDATIDPVQAAVGALVEPWVERSSTGRASTIASFTLLLEAARRPALREVSVRWTEAYLSTLGELLARAGSRRPREDAGLLMAAADGLLIEQLATGGSADPRPRLCRLASALVAGR